MKNIGKNLKTVGLGTVGAIGSKVVKNKIVPMIPGIGGNDLVKAAAPIALGIFLMENKNTMLQDIGLGMAISAAGDLAQEKIPGIGAITGEDMNAVAGQVIEGLNEQVDEILKVSDDLGDDLSDDLSDDLGDDLGDDLSDDLSDDLGDDLGDDMGDDN